MATHEWTPDENLSRRELFRLGHFHSEFNGYASWADVKQLDRDSVAFRRAVSSYQMTAELYEDENFGPHTVSSLRFRRNAHGHERVCDCPDILSNPEAEHEAGKSEELNISNGTRTWPEPKKPITFALRFRTLPGLSESQTKEAWRVALKNWNDTCGVNLVRIDDYNKALVPTWSERLSGSTLAIAALSQGHRRKGHWQKYDIRQWTFDYLVGVIIHETGHTLGFSHSNSGTSIMRPFINPNVLWLQSADRTRAQRYYGRPFDLEPDIPDIPDVPDIPDLPPEPPTGNSNLRGVLYVGKTSIVIRSGEAKIIKG